MVRFLRIVLPGSFFKWGKKKKRIMGPGALFFFFFCKGKQAVIGRLA